jgi:hypothetical protein
MLIPSFAYINHCDDEVKLCYTFFKICFWWKVVKHSFAVPSLDRKAVGRYKFCQTYQKIITNLS